VAGSPRTPEGYQTPFEGVKPSVKACAKGATDRPRKYPNGDNSLDFA
jgi:hypothetical protein